MLALRELVNVVRDRRQQPPRLEQLRDHPPPPGRDLEPLERRLDNHRSPDTPSLATRTSLVAVGERCIIRGDDLSAEVLLERIRRRGGLER